MAKDISIRNIDQLRQFGRNLSIASSNLINLFGKLNIQMHTTLDNWDDTQSQKFMVDFERRCQEIQKISEEMQRYSKYVSDVCEAQERATSIRY